MVMAWLGLYSLLTAAGARDTVPSQYLWVDAGIGPSNLDLGGQYKLNYGYGPYFMASLQAAGGGEFCLWDPGCGDGLGSWNALAGARRMWKYGFLYAALGIGRYQATDVELESIQRFEDETDRVYKTTHPSGVGIPFEIGAVLGKYGGLEIVAGCNLNVPMPLCQISFGAALGKFD